jgi:anti-anti-sigma factor
LPAQLNIQIIDSGPLEKVLVLPPLLDKERFAKFDVSRANLQYESLIYKACVDEAFRKRLLEAPLETLRETGLTIKASERVRVIECGEDEIIFPLHSLKGYFKEGAPLAERTLPRITGRELKVKLPARVDAVSSIKLEEDFSQIREDAVLDFSQVEYISSAGLRLLLVLRKRLDSQNLRLILQNLSPSVRHVFELTGLDKYLL